MSPEELAEKLGMELAPWQIEYLHAWRERRPFRAEAPLASIELVQDLVMAADLASGRTVTAMEPRRESVMALLDQLDVLE